MKLLNNQEEYFSKKVLDIKRPFRLIVASLLKPDFSSYNKLKEWLSSNSEILENGLAYFNANSEDSTFLAPSQVKIGTLTLKVTDKEKDLVSSFSEEFHLNPEAACILLKQFAASECCKNEWLLFLSDSTKTPHRYKFNQLNTIMSQLSSAFFQYYLEERLSIIKTMGLVACIWSDTDSLFNDQVQPLLESLFGSNVVNTTFRNLLRQLADHVFNIKELDHKWLIYTFQEYKAITEIILFMFRRGLTIDPSFVVEYVIWYLHFSSRIISTNKFINSSTESKLLEAESFEIALLIEMLEFDKLDYNCDPRRESFSSLVQNPSAVQLVLKNVLDAPLMPHNSILYLLFSIFASTVYISYSNSEDSELTKSTLDFFSNPSPYLHKNSSPVLFSQPSNVADVLINRSYTFKPFDHILKLISSSNFHLGLSYEYSPKQALKDLLIRIPTVFPIVAIKNLNIYTTCLVRIFQDDSKLCTKFWTDDFEVQSRRCFIDLIGSFFPAIYFPLLTLLRALSGTSAFTASKIVEYLKNRPIIGQFIDKKTYNKHLAINYSNGINFIEIEYEAPSLVADTISTPDPLSTVRGVVSVFNKKKGYIARWSRDFNGWVRIFEMLENTQVLNNTKRIPRSSDHDFLIIVLALIEKISISSQSTLDVVLSRMCINHDSLSYSRILFSQFISLFNHSVTTSGIPLNLTSSLMGFFRSFSPNILETLGSCFNGSSLTEILSARDSNGNTFPAVLYRIESRNQDYTCLLSYLDFISTTSEAFFKLTSNQKSDSDICLKLGMFLSYAYESIISFVFSKFISWKYEDPSQRFQIGNKCIDIFSFFINLSNFKDNSILIPFIDLFDEKFFGLDGHHSLTPILSTIVEGSNPSRHNVASRVFKEPQDFDLFLFRSLTFFTRLLTLVKLNPDLFQHTALTNMSFNTFHNVKRNIVSSCILLIDEKYISNVSIEATNLLTILIQLPSTDRYKITFTDLFLKNFDLVIDKIYNIVSEPYSDLELKKALWAFIGYLSLHHIELFHIILKGKFTINNLSSPFSSLDLNRPSLLKFLNEFFQDLPKIAENNTQFSAIIFKTLSYMWSHREKLSHSLSLVIQHTTIWSSLSNILSLDFMTKKDYHILAIKCYIYEIVNHELSYCLSFPKMPSSPLSDQSYQILFSLLFKTENFNSIIKEALYLPPIPNSLIEFDTLLDNDSSSELQLENYRISNMYLDNYYPYDGNYPFNASRFHDNFSQFYMGSSFEIGPIIVKHIKTINLEISYATFCLDLLAVQSELLIKARELDPLQGFQKELKAQLSLDILNSFVKEACAIDTSKSFNSEALLRVSSLILETIKLSKNSISSYKVKGIFQCLIGVYSSIGKCLRWKSKAPINYVGNSNNSQNTSTNWYASIDVLAEIFDENASDCLTDPKLKDTFQTGFQHCVSFLLEDVQKALKNINLLGISSSYSLVKTGLLKSLNSSLKLGSQSEYARVNSWDSTFDYEQFIQSFLKHFINTLRTPRKSSLTLASQSAQLLNLLCQYKSFRINLAKSNFIELITRPLKEIDMDFAPDHVFTNDTITHFHIWISILNIISRFCSSDSSHLKTYSIGEFLVAKQEFFIKVITKATSLEHPPLSFITLTQSLIRFITKLPVLFPVQGLSQARDRLSKLPYKLASVAVTWLLKYKEPKSSFPKPSSHELKFFKVYLSGVTNAKSSKISSRIISYLLHDVIQFAVDYPINTGEFENTGLSLAISLPSLMSFGTVVDMIVYYTLRINKIISSVPLAKLQAVKEGLVLNEPCQPRIYGKVEELLIGLEIVNSSFDILMKELKKLNSSYKISQRLKYYLVFDVVTELGHLSGGSRNALSLLAENFNSAKVGQMTQNIIKCWTHIEETQNTSSMSRGPNDFLV